MKTETTENSVSGGVRSNGVKKRRRSKSAEIGNEEP